MPAKIRTIDVFANPFHALDSEGTPQAVVQMPGTRNYIGAHLDHVKSKSEDRALFFFTGKKITVPFTGEIVTAVLEGSLIVADEKGARMCGLRSFVEPAKQLEIEKEAALARLRRAQGPDAELQPVPTEATPPPKASTEPAAEATASKTGTQVSPNVTLHASSEG